MAKQITRVEALLWDLCTKYGFCLSPDDRAALVAAPPGDVDSFVDAVLVAEGLDAMLCDNHTRGYLGEKVRDWLFDERRGKGRNRAFPSGLHLFQPARLEPALLNPQLEIPARRRLASS